MSKDYDPSGKKRDLPNRGLDDIIRPGISRSLDFVVLDELRKRTGVSPDSALEFTLNEMLCNALDKDATEIEISIQLEGEYCSIHVKDNGSKKLSKEEIELILDFESKASSKRGLLRVSRGYLGNALKCIFGFSYALAESRGLPPPAILVKSGGFEYRISLKPDRVKGIIASEVKAVEMEDDGFTAFTVRFPKEGGTEGKAPLLKEIISATSIVNLERRIHYDVFGDETTLGSGEGERIRKQETSVLCYTGKQFASLFEDYTRVRPETQLKEFIALFRGFTSKDTIREILQNLCSGNHDSPEKDDVQFLPTTPMGELSWRRVSQLCTLMKEKAKPIAKRSIPSVLGFVGKEAFEKVRIQNSWESLRYTIEAGTMWGGGKIADQLLSGDMNRVKYPYLVEIAIFDRKKEDREGLKVYQCVNFMASKEDIFSRIYNTRVHLAEAGVREDMPVTVVVHFVCPVLKWLNYGKSGLDE